MAVEFAITDWSGWTTPTASPPPGTTLLVSETPDASAIPSLLRRRLDTLGRAAAAEILRHTRLQPDVPVVYASRHGDLDRTLGVLTELARGEPVSPMNFSLSVHNAVPGILSIHSGITANITSISALDESLVPVLLEAVGLVREGRERVLCVLADVPVPELYQADCPWPVAPFAASFMVGAREGVTLTLSHSGDSAEASSAGDGLPEPLRFTEFLASGARSFNSSHNGGLWTITKH